MVFIAGNRVIVTTNTMFEYMWNKLVEYSKLEKKESRVGWVTDLLNNCIVNIHEHELSFNDEGTMITIDGQKVSLDVVSREEILEDDELRPIYEHCINLSQQKHSKWVKDEYHTEYTSNGIKVHTKCYKSNSKAVNPPKEETPINYHQLAVNAMLGIFLGFERDKNILVGKCVDIDDKYHYTKEQFLDFISFLKPFVCEENPITPISFDMLTYNYCNLYDELDNDTHNDVERLTMSMIKSNYRD